MHLSKNRSKMNDLNNISNKRNCCHNQVIWNSNCFCISIFFFKFFPAWWQDVCRFSHKLMREINAKLEVKWNIISHKKISSISVIFLIIFCFKIGHIYLSYFLETIILNAVKQKRNVIISKAFEWMASARFATFLFAVVISVVVLVIVSAEK